MFSLFGSSSVPLSVKAYSSQIRTVFRLAEFFRPDKQLLPANPSALVSNFLETADFETSTKFNCLDKIAGLKERFVRASIKPCHAASQPGYLQCPSFQINIVNIGN